MKRIFFVLAFLLVCGCIKIPPMPVPPSTAPSTASTTVDAFDYTANGCFPPKGDCYRIPDEANRLRCEAYQAGRKSSWPSDCNAFPNAACVALCVSQKGPKPQFDVSYPVKLSNNPEGFRGWPWPHIFTYNGRPLVQYWGSVNGWIGNYIIMQTDNGWTSPKELKAGPGTLVIGKRENYLLHWSGWDGAVDLVVLDENFNEKMTIPVQEGQNFRSWAMGAVDSKGRLHMSWNTLANGVWGLKYAFYDGNSVSAPQDIASSNEDQYGATPGVVVDSNDVVYVFWVQSVKKDNEGFYAYLKDGTWSSPMDLTNSKEDDCGNSAFVNGDEVHFFEQACGSNHTADLHHIVFKDGKIIKQETLDMPFAVGYAVFEQDKIHLMAIDPTTSELNGIILKFKFTIYHMFFDGASWHSQLVIPQQMIDNYEWNTVDLTPGLPESEMGIAPDGSREFVHEEHPEVVLLNGVLHVVFEYNQNGTYDAYYVTIKPK